MAVYGEFPEVRARLLHVPARLLAVGRRRRHGASQQHVHLESRAVDSRRRRGASRRSSTISHEFFHNWNVERIRPVGLEPFDFTRENITCCLWLAEGFTQYYGPLLLTRAGLTQSPPRQRRHADHQRRRAIGALGGADERVRGVLGRRDVGGRDRSQPHVHLVLHLRRGDRARARPVAARDVERQAVARRLHAAVVAALRQAGRPGAGAGRAALLAERHSRRARGADRQQAVRERLLRQVHRGARGRRLRDAARGRGLRAAAGATRRGLDRQRPGDRGARRGPAHRRRRGRDETSAAFRCRSTRRSIAPGSTRTT